MQDRENSLVKWFGERRPVRLMLLAALLALGVIHVEFIINTAQMLWRVATPLIAGAAIAYILEIIIKRLEKIVFPHTKNRWLEKSRRTVCILLSFVLLLSLVGLVVFTVIPGLVDAFTLLGQELPNYFSDFKEWLTATFQDVPQATAYLNELNLEWDTVQERVVNWALNGMIQGQLLSSTVTVIGAVTGGIANSFISVIFALFLLGDKENLHRHFNRVMDAAVSERASLRTHHVLTTANRCFSGFIVGQSVNALITGILTWLGMRIFRMPYALMVGVLSGTASLIPIIGGYIGAGLGTFLVFTASPSMAPWFLLFIVTLQTVQGNLLYPRLVGNSVGLPSLWVLAAVCVGGGLGGIGGMVVAVPSTATAYALLRDWVQKKNRDNKCPPAPREKTPDPLLSGAGRKDKPRRA
ncbi:MAG: AI-2E family transporter [Clostridia bacterium]|nr:AI-2E family transporter [Clostridia bacterium]